MKWSKFQNNITESIHDLRDVDDFYDVTLVGDDFVQVKAHKIVLSATSEYFKNILQSVKGLSHPVLCLGDLNNSDINNVMDFIYNGQLELPQDCVERYLAVAERLKLFGIYEPDNSNNETVKEPLSDLSVQKSNVYISHQKEDEHKIFLKSENRTEDLRMKKTICKKEILQPSTKTSDGSLSCHVCQKVFKMRHHMKEHLETHVSGMSYPCKSCDKIYKTSGSLRSHEHRQHRDEETQELKDIIKHDIIQKSLS